MPRRGDDRWRGSTMLRRTGFLRPKGGTRMTVAELKRKLRNSPFASLQVRITGALAHLARRRRRPPSAAACVQCRRERIPCDTPSAAASTRCPQGPRARDAARPRRLRDAALRRASTVRNEELPGMSRYWSRISSPRPRSWPGSASRRSSSSASRRRRTARAPGRGTRTDRPAALRALREPRTSLVTDVCLCEYTDHGHCGVSARARSPTTRRSSCSRGTPSPTRRPAPTWSRPPP